MLLTAKLYDDFKTVAHLELFIPGLTNTHLLSYYNGCFLSVGGSLSP